MTERELLRAPKIRYVVSRCGAIRLNDGGRKHCLSFGAGWTIKRNEIQRKVSEALEMVELGNIQDKDLPNSPVGCASVSAWLAPLLSAADYPV